MHSRTDDQEYKRKFLSALEFVAPSAAEMIKPNKITQDKFHIFKTIAMNYRKVLTQDMLFHQLHDTNLWRLCTFDQDLFLHMVRYTDSDAANSIVLREFNYLQFRYKQNKGLVLRPLFEKISQQTINTALLSMDEIIFYLLFMNIDPSDGVAFLQKAGTTIFEQMIKNGVDLVSAIISRNIKEYVDIIIPHLSVETILYLLMKGTSVKPLNFALHDYKKNLLNQIWHKQIPANSKDVCCNEAAVRIIELLPVLPPINMLFSKETHRHPFINAIYTNPRLMNEIMRKSSNEEIVKLKDILLEVYPYLDLDNAQRVYILCPEIEYNKLTNEKKLSHLNKLTSLFHPLMSYRESRKKSEYIKSQRKEVAETYDALPSEFDRNIRSIILEYTATDENMAHANHAVIKSMFDGHRLKAMYNEVQKKVKVKDKSFCTITDDLALLILQYATTDQHLFYILIDEINQNRSLFERYKPDFSQFSIFKNKSHESKSKSPLVNHAHSQKNDSDSFVPLVPLGS